MIFNQTFLESASHSHKNKLLLAAPIVEHHRAKLITDCEQLCLSGHTPYLKIFLVGNNPAGQIYTNNKKKFAEGIGAKCEIVQLPENVTPEEFSRHLHLAEADPSIHGILIQRPIPQHLEAHLASHPELLSPKKDVDGLLLSNMQHLLVKGDLSPYFIPCTPLGILELCHFYKIPLKGSNVVVIGRGHIVGRPLALLLENCDATVTLCHSQSKNISAHTKMADIIVCAIGKPRFLDETYLGPVKMPFVIDVGINKLQDKSLCGDADLEKLLPLVAGITPVPGGVGPLTILSLARNLIKAATWQRDHSNER